MGQVIEYIPGMSIIYIILPVTFWGDTPSIVT